MIQINNLSLSYEGVKILDQIQLDIPKGSIAALIGKSGAGKTSLLKCLAQLNNVDEGEILIEGNSLLGQCQKERVRLVGFVFQHFHLFPHMTILQNCMHPLTKVAKQGKKEAKQKVQEFLESLGLGAKQQSYPKDLSGGQQQRAALARALALGSKVLILDEPTSALDPQTTKDFVAILQNLSSRGVTVVLSSHDLHFLEKVLDKVYLLEGGKIKESFDASVERLQDKPIIAEFFQYET